jgi:hypothetical protein
MRYMLVISILLYHTLSPSPALQYKLEPIPLLYQSHVLYACYKHTIISHTGVSHSPTPYTPWWLRGQRAPPPPRFNMQWAIPDNEDTPLWRKKLAFYTIKTLEPP